jgi:hypothetical protein
MRWFSVEDGMREDEVKAEQTSLAVRRWGKGFL